MKAMDTAPVEIIIPSFGPDRYHKEGVIIGRLLAGYGELELDMCNCVGAATQRLDDAVRALFGVRGERKRIELADSMMRQAYVAVGFEQKYLIAIAGIHWCREVRNQYAHCHWYDTKDEGLCFINLEDAAKRNRNCLLPLKLHRIPVNEALLLQQEAYFKHVQKCFWHLEEAYNNLLGKNEQRAPIFNWPGSMVEPPKHN